MKKTIHQLRKKDQHEKDRIAFLGALVVTTFIALFWLVGFTVNPGSGDSQLANTKGPIDNIVGAAAEIFGDIKN